MRYALYLQLEKCKDNGERVSGFKTHVLTLATREASDKMIMAIQDGTYPWDDVISVDEILAYETKLGC